MKFHLLLLRPLALLLLLPAWVSSDMNEDTGRKSPARIQSEIAGINQEKEYTRDPAEALARALGAPKDADVDAARTEGGRPLRHPEADRGLASAEEYATLLGDALGADHSQRRDT